MRLRERFSEKGGDRLADERREPLGAEARRELEALDRAVAGLPVDPEHAGLAELVADLRAERAQPGGEFEAELDRLAAAGFPPRHGGRADRLARSLADARGRLRGLGARRLVPVAGAVATLLVVVGVAVSQVGEGGDGTPDPGGGGEPAVAPAAVEPPATTGEASDAAGPASGGEAGALLAPEGGAQRSAPRSSPGARGRREALSVDLTLATEPEAFRAAADGVLDVVAAEGGFVVRSRVSGGDASIGGAQPGRASFELRIPSRRLPTALAALSDLGSVVSRTDGSIDITGRFRSAQRRIAAYGEARLRLLRRLEDASTADERQSIRARLRVVERGLARAERDLDAARTRVRMVPVGVTILGDGAGVVDDGAWGIGEALDDAGRILEGAAGVALVSGAVALPVAILVALAALTRRGWVRRERDRALDAAAGPAR